jgi:peptide/nickel transport system substrate-binding protein
MILMDSDNDWSGGAGIGGVVMVESVSRIRSSLVAIVVAIVLAVPIAAVAGAIGTTEALPPTVLRMGFLERIDSLNPYVGINGASYVFYGLVYDALASVGNNLEVTPNLATSCWKVPATDPELQASGEPFGSVWEYNLTHNAVWSDGVAFTADDAAFSINLNAGNYTSLWAYQPYSYFMKWAAKIDNYTIRIHFFERMNNTPMPVAYGDSIEIHILPMHKLMSMDAFTIGFSWTGLFIGEDPPLVGTGPFIPTATLRDDWLAGSNITLVRNPNYHGFTDYGQLVRFDEIDMRFYDNETNMSNALKNGELDVAQLSREGYSALNQEVMAGTVHDIVPFTSLSPDQHFTNVLFNCNFAGPNPARLDPLLRAALHEATDKTAIVQNNYSGLATVGSTLISPVNPAWHLEMAPGDLLPYNLMVSNFMMDFSGYYDLDLDGVREASVDSLAVQMGWVAEGTHLIFQMLVSNERPEELGIALFLQDQWAQVGVQLNLLVVDDPNLWTRVYSYNYDCAIGWWTSDVDPNYILFVQSNRSWNGWSDNKFFDPDYEENYTQSVSALDYAERKSYVDNCQMIHYYLSAYIVLAYLNQTYAWRNDTFTGWGDWSANPGRSIDAVWTANPLYFDLTPITLPIPEFPIVLIPVAGMLAVFMVATLSKRQGRPNHE